MADDLNCETIEKIAESCRDELGWLSDHHSWGEVIPVVLKAADALAQRPVSMPEKMPSDVNVVVTYYEEGDGTVACIHEEGQGGWNRLRARFTAPASSPHDDALASQPLALPERPDESFVNCVYAELGSGNRPHEIVDNIWRNVRRFGTPASAQDAEIVRAAPNLSDWALVEAADRRWGARRKSPFNPSAALAVGLRRSGKDRRATGQEE